MSDSSAHQNRITFCITELDVGGAEKALVRIAIGLKSLGWQVRVISLRDKGPMAEPLEADNIPVTSLNCGGFFDLRIFGRLRDELQRSPTDVLYCFLHQANLCGRMVAKSTNVRVVLSGIRVADRRLSVRIPERLTQGKVDHYVAVSDSVAKFHAELCGISESKISAIPNGVDLPSADRLKPDQTVEKHRLLFVGRLTPQKNPMCLLDAFCRLPNELQTNTELLFVGDGPLRAEMQRFIRNRQLENGIQLLGQRDDVSSLMQQAALLVLPSRWEGLPNVVLEAMANGLPVVATAVDGTRDVVTDGRNGWLVSANEPDLLAEAIRKALENPDERSKIAEAARTFVEQNYSWTDSVKKHDELLRSLLAK